MPWAFGFGAVEAKHALKLHLKHHTSTL